MSLDWKKINNKYSTHYNCVDIAIAEALNVPQTTFKSLKESFK